MERDIDLQEERADYDRRHTLSAGSVELISNSSWGHIIWPLWGFFIFVALLTGAVLEASKNNWGLLFIAIVWLVPLAYCCNRYRDAQRRDNVRDKIERMDTVTKFETAIAAGVLKYDAEEL